MPSRRHTGQGPTGLTPEEAADRLRRLGPNSLPAPRVLPLWRRVSRALADPLVLVLLAAMALTIATGDHTDSLVIALVVLVNTTLGVRQEVSADRAVRALDQLVAPVARTLRGGREVSCPVAELVPGDLVLLRQGDLVPADAVLLSGVAFRVDQSALTGESVAVDKAGSPDPGPSPPSPSGPSEASEASGTEPPATSARAGTTVAPDALTAGDGALYSGTVVVHGRGLARVTATGAASALGRIAGMLQSPHRATPLQRRMTQLSAYLAGGAVALCSVVLVLGVLRGQSFELMLLTAVSLVVAAVPESLPVVVTVSLALAARRMAARHAVVRHLAAVETLGSVTLLATDKTGTLTQARMVLVGQWRPAGVDEPTLMRAVVLCNDAVLDPATGRVTGDPTEVALLQAAAGSGVVPDVVDAQLPRVDEVPFDSVRKRMTTVHADGDARLVVCKGAPDGLLRPELVSEPAEVVAAARGRRSASPPVARAYWPWRSGGSNRPPPPPRLGRTRAPGWSRGCGCWGWWPCATRCAGRPRARWPRAARPGSTWPWSPATTPARPPRSPGRSGSTGPAARSSSRRSLRTASWWRSAGTGSSHAPPRRTSSTSCTGGRTAVTSSR